MSEKGLLPYLLWLVCFNKWTNKLTNYCLFLRAAEIIFSLAEAHARHHGSSSLAVEQLYGLLTNARQNLGVFQHHDGITGTAKDFVVADYGTRYKRHLS